MDNTSIETLFNSKLSQITVDNRYQLLGIDFNPFPRSGIADLNSTSEVVMHLSPIEQDAKDKIVDYVVDSLFAQNPHSEDKYLSIVIRGDYGYGKTQTLLYSKFLLEFFQKEKKYDKNPYVVYIDNPGGRLTELIGSIISQIGEENFKRYIWNILFEKISKNERYKADLLTFPDVSPSLFAIENYIDPFNSKYIVSYKSFIDNLYKLTQKDIRKRKQLGEKLQLIVTSILIEEFENPIVSTFFYELLSENFGVNKIWDAITSGAVKELDKKEVFLLRAIVKLLNRQGFTDFYILVDEFEAITASGRLSASETERYISNLRALIDRQRNWCSIFAMTGLAFTKLKSISPPLADRIGGRIIDLKPLSDETAKSITLNYLNLARKVDGNIRPFTDEAIIRLNSLSGGILRIYLKACYSVVQRALENKITLISPEFVDKFFQHEEE